MGPLCNPVVTSQLLDSKKMELQNTVAKHLPTVLLSSIHKRNNEM